LQSSNEEEAKYAKQNLRNVFLDLFFAGSETMSTTLRWAILYMVIHPEIQVKIKVIIIHN
jgi:cytochrome P450 family 2 subfamily J